MRRFNALPLAFFACLLLAGPIPPLDAAIDLGGDVNPADADDWSSSRDGTVGYSGLGTLVVNDDSDLYSRYGYIGRYSGSTGEVTIDGTGSTWTNGSNLYVGYSGNGTLDITGAAVVSNPSGYIGYHDGSTGAVTVTGAGSMWINDDDLHVGRSGSGTLNINEGGVVSVGDDTYVADEADSIGLIDFGSGGGTLDTRTLYAASAQLVGTGTINTRGLVADFGLTFDSTHGANQTFTLASLPGQDVTVNLDVSGGSGLAGNLGAGYRGNGTLSIRDGIVIRSASGHIGYAAGSTGVVTVDGAGSTWISDSQIVGYEGSGTLAITGAGTVSTANSYIGYSPSYIGYDSDSAGVVTVDGAGSTLTSTYLYLGVLQRRYAGSHRRRCCQHVLQLRRPRLRFDGSWRRSTGSVRSGPTSTTSMWATPAAERSISPAEAPSAIPPATSATLAHRQGRGP